MASSFLPGFLLSLTLILAIGAQNAFVLRQGLRGEHVLAVCLACALSDAALIAAGVGGFGALARIAPWTAALMRWGGVAFLVVYGALSMRAAGRGGESLEAGRGPARALGPTLATCLALTWLNPHVYLDTVVLLGSVAVEWEGRRFAFGLGAVVASFVFFFGLGYGARLPRPLFARPGAWRVLDVLVACVMWSIAAGLAFG
jgi:L-lysine exporter family protein LysE/ArgO